MRMMPISVLTPAEKYEYRRLVGHRSRVWGEICYWLVVVLVCLKLFVVLPDWFWLTVGHWSLLVSGYIAFFSTPYLMYRLVARGVKDGSFAIERTMPIQSHELLLRKLKVTALVILRSVWPCLLLAWISDPTLSLSEPRLAGTFLLQTGTASPWMLLGFGAVWYVGLWALMAGLMLHLAMGGVSLVTLAGHYIFWLGALLMLLAWWDERSVFVASDGTFPGYPGLVVTGIAILLGLIALLHMQTKERLADLG